MRHVAGKSRSRATMGTREKEAWMSEKRSDGVSAATDELTADLLGQALDLLACGQQLNVLLVVGDAHGTQASYQLADDDAIALLEGARMQVERLVASGGDPAVGLACPVRYALAYEGAVEIDDGSFSDALLVEFGETGYKAYSAYCLFHGRGRGDAFEWTDPAPAGEVEPLL